MEGHTLSKLVCAARARVTKLDKWRIRDVVEMFAVFESGRYPRGVRHKLYTTRIFHLNQVLFVKCGVHDPNQYRLPLLSFCHILGNHRGKFLGWKQGRRIIAGRAEL